MDRLIAANSVNLAGADVAPGAGTPQYATNGNPALNIPATKWPAYQYNALQEEVIGVILAAGIALDKGDNTQLLAAIKRLNQSQAGNYVVSTNVTNAYSITLAPAPLSYAALIGVPIRVKWNATLGGITGATLNVNALGVKSMYRDADSHSLWLGDIAQGGIGTVVYDGTGFQLLEVQAFGNLGVGSWPSVNVANDGAAHTIATIGSLGNTNFGAFSINWADTGTNSTWSAMFPAPSGATTIQPAIATFGSPGTNVLSASGNNLQLTRTGGAANVSVNIRQYSA